MNPFLSFVQELGQDIQREWESFSFDLDSFPQIAASHLQGNLIPCPSFPELIEHFHPQANTCLPLDSNESFGQPPITLFRTDRFLIDVYFWFSLNTSFSSKIF